jgi:hypothetical protein
MNLVPENLTFSEVGHLPIVKDFAKKIGLVETLNAMVDSQMEISPGITVLAMVLDTLSGRTPLYRLEEFFQEKDIELVLGHEVKAEVFCFVYVDEESFEKYKPASFKHLMDGFQEYKEKI